MNTYFQETMSLLKKRTDSVETIARASSHPEWDPSLIVTTGWLRKVMNGEILDPSVHRIQAVNDYLTGRPQKRRANK